MNRLSDHLRHNVVAYLALFVALGGTSYAAVNLPPGSVGTRQLRNHSVTPVKLGRTGAVVRYWALVSGTGRVVDSGSVRPRVAGAGGGNADIDFAPGRHQLPGRCFVLGSVEGLGGPPSPNGTVTFSLHDNHEVSVATAFPPAGLTPAPVAVAVLCSP